MTHDVTRHVHIAILGTGFAGLGAAIRLKQTGVDDFLLFERAKDVGGTWRDNSYPGCACDVESHLYSFSFAPNPEWSRMFSPQPEIFAYLRKCADDYGIVPHVRFDHAIGDVRWNDDARRWHVSTSHGPYTADIVISAMGALCEPSIPEIAGMADFQGTVFHSARWNHDFDFAGKRVAVIGTGASAIQFVPEIQAKVQKLTLFQRTPAWVLPRMDREISEDERSTYRKFPLLQKAVRSAIYARRELFVLGLRNPRSMAWLERFALKYLESQVPDAALRKKLTPDFRIGCKRVLISRDYLRSLGQPNVDVVTSGIREVRAHSVVTSDGVEHPVDAIVFGTGFKVTEMPFADHIYGRSGASLNQLWQGSPEAHLGAVVSGFPNFFSLLGPNTGLGHTSVVVMIEAQLQLVIEAITHMRAKNVGTLEVRSEVQQQFVSSVNESMKGTVWTAGGCASWYLDKTGRNSTLWPSFTFDFMKQAHFRANEYLAGPARTNAERNSTSEPAVRPRLASVPPAERASSRAPEQPSMSQAAQATRKVRRG